MYAMGCCGSGVVLLHWLGTQRGAVDGRRRGARAREAALPAGARAVRGPAVVPAGRRRVLPGPGSIAARREGTPPGERGHRPGDPGRSALPRSAAVAARRCRRRSFRPHSRQIHHSPAWLGRDERRRGAPAQDEVGDGERDEPPRRAAARIGSSAPPSRLPAVARRLDDLVAELHGRAGRRRRVRAALAGRPAAMPIPRSVPRARPARRGQPRRSRGRATASAARTAPAQRQRVRRGGESADQASRASRRRMSSRSSTSSTVDWVLRIPARS